MSFTEKNIFELLPAYYRSKDIEQGSPLQALINIIAGKAIAVENNLAQLYDNWFIETCEEWVVPYIADLLGVQNFNAITGSSVISQRAYIANTISYRRRKGTAPVLEQLASDITGWRAHVVEFFQLLGTTQYMNHIRLNHPVTPDLRSMNQLDLLNTAFDSIGHTVDVRHISSGRGKYNIPNIGLFIWRIQSYRVALADAAVVPCPSSPPDSYFTFSPLGYDLQLFNNPKIETAITHISEEINVPGLLRRRTLFEELEAKRQSNVDGTPVSYNYFDDQEEVTGDPTTRKHPVFEIYKNDDLEPVNPEEIFICNLENCCTPPKSRTYTHQQLQSDGSYKTINIDKPITVAIDPVAGRFTFTDPTVAKARVSYSYGFSGNIGSGTYNRQDSVSNFFKKNEIVVSNDSVDSQNPIWQVGVSKTIKPVGQERIFTTIKEALAEWDKENQASGIISIMDNCTYNEEVDIIIKEKSKLLIIAADWPAVTLPDALPGQQERIRGDIVADGLQPVLQGNIVICPVMGSPHDFETKTGGQITLNGLLLQGNLTVSKGNLGALNLNNCTIVPDSGKIEIGTGTTDLRSNQWLKIAIQKSICGPINLHNTEIDSLVVEDCIIDNSGEDAILINKAPLQLSRTTIFGKVSGKTLTADNCIFDDTVTIERRQMGCIRFSFVPYSSSISTPRRFHCQPDLEINNQITDAKNKSVLTSLEEDNIRKAIVEWLSPSFTATHFGDYGYAQLSTTCPLQISTGADNGAEMGVFNFLKQPQRRANLLIALDEYLRLGLEAGLIYVT